MLEFPVLEEILGMLIMNKEPQGIDQILPYGEMLRGFMEQPFVTKGDLKEVLRNRGIFTHTIEKANMIPILLSTILSPREFDFLRECQISKEDNPKVITQTVKFVSQETLFDSIPEILDFDSILDLEYANFKVTGSPAFIPVDNNHERIKIDFTVERKDMSKNWVTTNNIFSGSLELSKTVGTDEVKIIIIHTAPETRQVATKLASNMVKHFKDEGLIHSSASVEKILFSRFSNSKRISYLFSLTKESRSQMLEFIDIVDVQFSPDTINSLPEGIDWMEQKIADLKLNGSTLHQTIFFTDIKYHDFICLYNVDSKFKFDVKGLTGQCVFSVGFPDYRKDKNLNAEMEVNIKSISFDNSSINVSKSEVKQVLLREIENQKINSFKLYSDIEMT
jgi:hypothetical protein